MLGYVNIIVKLLVAFFSLSISFAHIYFLSFFFFRPLHRFQVVRFLMLLAQIQIHFNDDLDWGLSR